MYVNEARQNSPSEQNSTCFQKLLVTFSEFSLVKRAAFLAACFFVKDEVYWVLTNCPPTGVGEELYVMKEGVLCNEAKSAIQGVY